MNLTEAAVWIDGLFPGESSIVKVGDFHVASFFDGDQHVAATLDFQQVETGLESDGSDIRVELFAVANDGQGLKELVTATASMLRDTDIVPQPGSVVPGAGALAGIKARHSLLVVPFTWGGDVPHFKDAGVMTLMLQILPLTDAELEYLQVYGLQDLQAALVEQKVNIFDVNR